jgi:hypothetical protein
MTFGISPDIQPISLSGKIELKAHHLFLERRRAKEKAIHSSHVAAGGTLDPNEERVLVPRSSDALLGRGRHYHGHPGNRRLQALVDHYTERYDKASNFEKTVIVGILLGLFKDPPQPNEAGIDSNDLLRGGRLLVSDTMGWKIIDNEMARARLSHKFRNQRRKPRQPSNNNNNKKASMATTTKTAAAIYDAAPDLGQMGEWGANRLDCFGVCKRQRLG